MSKKQAVSQQYENFNKDKQVATGQTTLEERLARGKARLETEALGGKLYSSECQKVGVQLPEEIVDSFKNHEEYVQTFQPFIYEETRESIRNGFNESCSSYNQMWAIYISSFAPRSDGWVTLDVKPQVEHKRGLKEGALVILINHRPPHYRDLQRSYKGGAFEWAQSMLKIGAKNGEKGQEQSNQDPYFDKSMENFCILPAIVRSHFNQNSFQKDTLVLDVHPQCEEHQQMKDNSNYLCSKVYQKIMKNPKQWWLVSCGIITSFQREFETLIHFRNLDLMSESVLDPYTAFCTVDYSFEKNWPEELTTPEFLNWINQSYDQSQLEAIRKASAHLPHIEWTAEAIQNQQRGSRKTLAEQFKQKQEKEQQLEGTQEAINQQFENIQNNYQYTRFTLIQGPPGTGKTYTIQGILNVWHITQYQRYYNYVMQTIIERLEKISVQKSQAMQNGQNSPDNFQQMIFADRVEIEQILEESQQINIKPHILVCAPSNAATDELLERILKNGFRDANSAVYRPNILRVGSEDAPLSNQARMVWVDMKEASSSELINTDPKALQQRKDDLARNLMRCKEDLDKINLELYRLEVIAGRFYDNFNPREAREKIELSFIDKADLVLTTLSSSGRRTLSNSKNPFTMVLVDEACQAQEVACLQPLIYGCKKCVLVGDPQQLPSTVLSQSSKERMLERSLFERLSKKGAIPHLLQVQYRMHPEIRFFPSKYFYYNQLIDAPQIVKMSLERGEVLNHASFYKHHLLKPYVLFNVEKGMEQKNFTKSWQNQAEADLACALFMELREHLITENQSRVQRGLPGVPLTQVGVITPYKQQRNCIQQTFERILGVAVAQEVKIETVDSYQGKQMDVIILSCVRASISGGTVGFVADVRRMNVAITRAKKSLWILGNVATLKQDDNWSQLIQDAEQRGTIINDANAWDLFPKLSLMQQQTQENERHGISSGCVLRKQYKKRMDVDGNNQYPKDKHYHHHHHNQRLEHHQRHQGHFQKSHKNPNLVNQNNNQQNKQGQIQKQNNAKNINNNNSSSNKDKQGQQQENDNQQGGKAITQQATNQQSQHNQSFKENKPVETQQSQKANQVKRTFSDLNKQKSGKKGQQQNLPKIDISQQQQKKKTPQQIAHEMKMAQQQNNSQIQIQHQRVQQQVQQVQDQNKAKALQMQAQRSKQIQAPQTLNKQKQNKNQQNQGNQIKQDDDQYQEQLITESEQEATDYEILKKLQMPSKQTISPRDFQISDNERSIIASPKQDIKQQKPKSELQNNIGEPQKLRTQNSFNSTLQKVLSKDLKKNSNQNSLRKSLLKKSSRSNDALQKAIKGQHQDLAQQNTDADISIRSGNYNQNDDKVQIFSEDDDFSPPKKRAQGLIDNDDVSQANSKSANATLRNNNNNRTIAQSKAKKVQVQQDDSTGNDEGNIAKQSIKNKELPKVRKEVLDQDYQQQDQQHTKKQKQSNLKRELESLTKGLNLDATQNRRSRQPKATNSESQNVSNINETSEKDGSDMPTKKVKRKT